MKYTHTLTGKGPNRCSEQKVQVFVLTLTEINWMANCRRCPDTMEVTLIKMLLVDERAVTKYINQNYFVITC